MDIKAIETVYKGYKFRSRLEARWAVFFDVCGVEWEYEPEGYNVDGLCYLPDFLLHDVSICHDEYSTYVLPKLWVEVKGVMDEASAEKIIKFADFNHEGNGKGYRNCYNNPILVLTNIPQGDCWSSDDTENSAYSLRENMIKLRRDCKCGQLYLGGALQPFDFGLLDGASIGAFPVVNKLGSLEIVADSCDYQWNMDEEKTVAAYDLARQAQFEHGVRPDTTLPKNKSDKDYSNDWIFLMDEVLGKQVSKKFIKRKRYENPAYFFKNKAKVIDAKYFKTFRYRYGLSDYLSRNVYVYEDKFYLELDIYDLKFIGLNFVFYKNEKGILLVDWEWMIKRYYDVGIGIDEVEWEAFNKAEDELNGIYNRKVFLESRMSYKERETFKNLIFMGLNCYGQKNLIQGLTIRELRELIQKCGPLAVVVLDMLNGFRQRAKFIDARLFKTLEYTNSDGSIHYVPVYEYEKDLYLCRIDVDLVPTVFDYEAEFYQNASGDILISWEYCLNKFYQKRFEGWEEWMHSNFEKARSELNGIYDKEQF